MKIKLHARPNGFTLVEILLALTLSGLALLSAFLLLDSFIRSAESQVYATWNTIERARFEKFLVRSLEDAAWNGTLAWEPTGATTGTSDLDWVLAFRTPASMIHRNEDDRPVLPPVFELGWRRDEGLVFRGRSGEERVEPPDFRPLLPENPFSEVVFYEMQETEGAFEEIRPLRSQNQATPPLPHIIHLQAAGEDGEDFWIYLPVQVGSTNNGGRGGERPNGRQEAPRGAEEVTPENRPRLPARANRDSDS